ncbi:MAG: DUF559 domain-containing protein [Hyphomonas sp.]
MRDNEKKTVAKARSLRRRMTKAEVILWQSSTEGNSMATTSAGRCHCPYIADFACTSRG